MSSDGWEEIKIIGLDVDRTQPSTSGSAMRLMHLTLASAPPSAWSRLFDEQRKFPRHGMWRRAYISGQHIVVDCVPEEIEQYHLRDLKEDVAAVNERYRELLAQKGAQDAAARRRQRKEREDLEGLADRLKFD